MQTRPPNVLWIMTDEHRADHLGLLLGDRLRTPNLDRLAGAGVRMERAYCTTPLCVPTRTTCFTGQYAAQRQEMFNNITITADEFSVPSALADAGYQLALVGKNHAFPDNFLEHWDFVAPYDMAGKREFPGFEPPTEDEREVIRWRAESIPYFDAAIYEAQPGGAKAEPAIAQTDKAMDFLDKQAGDKPWFLHLSYEAPHCPLVLPEPYFSSIRPEEMPGKDADPAPFSGKPARLLMQYYGLHIDEMSDSDVRHIQAVYCRMIEMVDDQLGRVFAKLEELGELDNTIILFQSDHGDFQGNHGMVSKTNACYEDLLRIPMIWSGPGICADQVSGALIDTSDIAPTLLDLLGIAIPDSVQGDSFARILQGKATTHRTRIVAENSLARPACSLEEIRYAIVNREKLLEEEGPMWFVNRLGGMTRSLMNEDGLKLILNENDTPELYDLSSDPGEKVNLAHDVRYRKIVAQMTKELDATDLSTFRLAKQELAAC